MGGEIEEHFKGYGEILGKKFSDFEKLSEHHKKMLKRLETDIEEIDLNPVVVYQTGACVLDSRIIVRR
jgi:hypothetical protein